MALNTLKCNHLASVGLKGLIILFLVFFQISAKFGRRVNYWPVLAYTLRLVTAVLECITNALTY